MDGDAPAEGAYDLRMRAFAHPGAKAALAQPTELPGVTLTEGRFSVELDIPEDPDGITWVEVAVRRAGSGEAYEKLGDPQPISKANSTCPGAWALDGNSGMPAGSFLGIAETSATPLVLKARNTAVATFTPRGTAGSYGDAPSVALGSASNVASGIGATVGGGGSTQNLIGNPCPDCKNTAGANLSTVGGGAGNLAQGLGSTIGGDSNRAIGFFSTVGGGAANRASGYAGTVGGGGGNCAGGDYSWAGGRNAKIRSALGTVSDCGSNATDGNGDEGSFVWADSQNDDFVSTGPNQFAIRASGGLRWAGTGVNSTTSPAFTHQADTGVSGNTCAGGSGVANSRTAINHPLLNGNPNAVIVMTPNYGPSAAGIAPPRNPLAVYYNSGADGNCAANRWVIYDVTTSPAPLNNGVKFNIWFVLP